MRQLGGCADARRSLTTDRRSFVKAGLLGSTGLGLADLLRSQAHANANSPASRNRSVIILWMRGGPSHIDMWDPKPNAPVEVRGEFGTISTPIPGIQLTDMLPKSAKIMHRWSIIRSLHHHDAGHSAGDQICFTGYDAGPMPDVNIYPSVGSIVSKQLGHLTPHLPAYVMIPRQVPGTGSAYLGIAHKPFETQADPARPGKFRVPNFDLPQGVTVERVGDRKGLLQSFDSIRRDVDRTGSLTAADRFQQQAWDILTSSAARDAFDLDREAPAVRERYGFLPEFDPKASNRCGCPAWSQRILLARRLVEAGVRLVTVDLRWWDTHVKGFESLKQGFLPRWDQAYSALLEDLAARGLLESTMVLAWGEFGRTPRINNDAGRDHYPNVFSAAIAGGGVQGGRVIGESDEKGAFPKTNPKTPQDVLKTVYDFLGVQTDVNYLTNTGRPVPVLPHGSPIRELFA
ncbi:DUF1501 domain-containing protein [Tuwongella immobilis]|uniref:DUF1501 domain-containing protein n=1 Tax=Tuwongella immobilis TaxID=692036 RepID=A0A6C2YUU9_9BACT|nr:DUF1501 domain-containing protein [Tuwongella immobilis]VIP05171.1 hypothetical protein : Uncharacterized protein OS=Pirellula staleyi (strain ATCC 27377 / DSM 6068 / ICPB 4128) GN=Psta_0834 PE=4 SV=1: DUF1501 [Tuwongella immobilis]VTS07698.1 hypothetical protein : Uncharacterized protein OS=Pirellula staleyi (strain ATCC 27377 / DSM 6068 / ICPB 4128) GN=Psta_0834 PE=4 SV=1: DUF1501 [Tuwongella immobilis]